MSGSASATSDSVVNNFNGGRPGRNDEIPAIIFCVALGLTVPLLLYRIISKKHRSKILGNAVLFFILRSAAFAIRAYMAKHSYTESTLIAELVLTSISYLFLINSLIDMWQKHENQKYTDNPDFVPTAHSEKKAKWVKYVAWFLRGALLASLVTAISGGAVLGRNFNNDQKVTVIRNLVKASYILSLATTVVGILGILVSHFTNHRSVKKTLFLLSYSVPLMVVGIYRVVEVFTGYHATTRQLIAFWVAMALFEFIAYCMTLAISIPKWFGNHVLHRHDSDDEKRIRQSESTFRPSTTGN